jgi:hypothetical protein
MMLQVLELTNHVSLKPMLHRMKIGVKVPRVGCQYCSC